MTADDAGSVISGDLGSFSIWFTVETYGYTAVITRMYVDSNNFIFVYFT